MEYYSSSDQGFLEELLASTFLPKPDHFIFNNNAIGWGGFDSLDQNQNQNQNPSLTNDNLPHFYHTTTTSHYHHLQQDFSSLPLDLNNSQIQTQTTTSSSLNVLHDHSTTETTRHHHPFNNILSLDYEADLDYPIFSIADEEDLDTPANFCKTEPVLQVPPPQQGGFNSDLGIKGKVKKKKIDGQPSKNLMAERRRRKRLNDRLSMLRSVVPKISKMDRTSILGDTIDYMKELIERINKLQEEIEVGPHEQQFSCIFNDIHHVVKPNEASSTSNSTSTSTSSFMIRNSPKFDVERRSDNNKETRIEICCAPKPGLLLSTVKTLEALDIEIQHCVISCFNDFAFKASCSQEMEQSGIISSEDIKQALFRNAGYGGRCL